MTGPSSSTLLAFGCHSSATPLEGGQNSTWRSGDFVLKPMFDADGAVWEAETLSHLPEIGYRIAQPIRTKLGNWIHEGWTAQRHLEGSTPNGSHLEDRFAAARSLHHDLRETGRPPHFDQATDPWALAEKATFGQTPWTPDPRIASCLERLKRIQNHPGNAWQVIHGDLTGNFLIIDGHPPAIIDFTPKWSPVGFGEAIMAVDLCLWEGVPFDQVKPLLTPVESDLIPLAAIRRLLEVDTRHKLRRLSDDVFDQVAAYENFAAILEA